MYNMLGKLVVLIVKVPEEMLGTLYDLVEKLVSGDGQIWLNGLKKFLRKEPCWITLSDTTEKVNTYLCRLYNKKQIVLLATDGTETLAQAGDVFTDWVDPDFYNWDLNVFGKPTERTAVMVHEMVKNGTFFEIYDSLGSIDDLCFSQSQIKQFVDKHTNKLQTGGDATFFLFTRGDQRANVDMSNVFVAGVRRGDRGLSVRVNGFSNAYVWRAGSRSRFVVPQQ